MNHHERAQAYGVIAPTVADYGGCNSVEYGLENSGCTALRPSCRCHFPSLAASNAHRNLTNNLERDRQDWGRVVLCPNPGCDCPPITSSSLKRGP